MAEHLAGDEGWAWVRAMPPDQFQFFVDMLAVRTFLFDEVCCGNLMISADGALLPATAQVRPLQIVLLGAGFDTRAFRLGDLAGSSIYEVDLAEVIALKERVLGDLSALPRCARRRAVPVDISAAALAAPLIQAGFDPTTPTLWAAEALTGYLSETAVHSLALQLTRLSAYGSQAILTFVGGSREANGVGRGQSKRHTFCTDQGGEVLSARGWAVRQRRLHELAPEARRSRLLGYDYWIVSGCLGPSEGPPAGRAGLRTSDNTSSK